VNAWFSWETGILTAGGYLLSLILLPIVLLTKKKEPVSTVAWVMAIVGLPYLGAFLFLVFGINRVTKRIRSRQQITGRTMDRLRKLGQHHLLSEEMLTPLQRTMMLVAHRVGASRATGGNQVKLLSDTPQAFAEIELALADAKSSIHLEYYIWQPDGVGTRLRDLLIAKAQQGVRVRFLYDGLGSMWLTHRFLQPMRDAGIKLAPFVPGQTFRERWSINLRSHRKIVVVDGRIGFTGGMNVGDEYLGKDPHFGYWRDTHLRLTGPTVRQLQEIFTLDWLYATGEDVIDAKYFPQPLELGATRAQILSGGPDEDESTFHSIMFAAITEARKEITLSTSYFVPPPALASALEIAARRGVRTRVMLSGPKTYWHTRHAARSFFDPLLSAGVEIYEYTRGQLHSKVLTIDGEWSLVGTPNFDARSIFLNFELAAAIYDHSIARDLSMLFDQDIPDARRIHLAEWEARPTWERLKENYCRMFSPIL